jgi:hypothetical protein
MRNAVQHDPAFVLSGHHYLRIDQARTDLVMRSQLHPAFIRECIKSIDEKRKRSATPLIGEIFPHIVAEGLQLGDRDRRDLAAAWLAMYGYISISDFEIDRRGHIPGVSSLACGSLLAWSIATVSRFTVGTPFHHTFTSNVARAFAAQYADVEGRKDPNFDRAAADADKNRAVVAMISGYCAAARQPTSCLVDATERVLGSFQILDDLQDVCEDAAEDNLTAFVRVLRDVSPKSIEAISEPAAYAMLVRDGRVLDELERVVPPLEEAMLMLDAERDGALLGYLGHLTTQVRMLIRLITDARSNHAIDEPTIYGHIREIVCHC